MTEFVNKLTQKFNKFEWLFIKLSEIELGSIGCESCLWNISWFCDVAFDLGLKFHAW